MRRVLSATAVLALAAFLAGARTASSQSPAASPALSTPLQGVGQPPTGYRPGLGDLMTETIQPRHIKLGLAGKQGNWVYAAYEAQELDEAFQRAALVWPKWQNFPFAMMEKFNMTAPIAAVEQAISAHDAAKFEASYKLITETCDSCHQAAGRRMVVIKVPDASMFPDQEFAPPPH